MSQFIDRRKNSKHKSAVNRQRFIHRFRKQIKRAVSDAVTGRSITNIEEGETINIPTKDISEPSFNYGEGGSRDIILPGNTDFTPGDTIKRPPKSGGKGQGSSASNKGEGEDGFDFKISREEFLEMFFEDLELPNLTSKQIVKTTSYKYVRAGYTVAGIPANINIRRSMRCAVGRKIALKAALKRKIAEIENELNIDSKKSKNTKLIKELERLNKRLKIIPFIDPIDLRYNNRVKQVKPNTQAVMFCLMDVSGSMDEAKKDAAKRFFILLYLFLQRCYQNVELVFIRHHTSAKEVDEHNFFYSRETGGTVVSSALELMQEIMHKRYPSSEWNIYGAQASDGDNWNNDSPRCKEILTDKILPWLQYFAYIEIMPRHHQSLWEVYKVVSDQFPNFQMQNISHAKDIYPVFRKLFQKKIKKSAS